MDDIPRSDGPAQRDDVDHVPRPDPPARLDERIRSWIEWLGPARLVTSSIAVIVVCLGGWWLLRSPVPPAESALPRATVSAAATTSLPLVTLPTPSRAGASAGTLPSSSVVIVHVAGSVVRPGVYELPSTGRVVAAVEAAGGATAEADTSQLNLASPLVDGSRIYVPAVGEEVAPLVVPSGTAVGGNEANGAAIGGVVLDVNTATADELDELPGVGPATASAIVTERDRNGPFVSIDDLERVPGIGPAKLAAMRDLVTT